MALDPAADITDVYAFVSYDAANLGRAPADRKVTLIMNVVPGQEPGSGPNYFSFDDNVRYQIIVDNDRSGGGLDDLVYEVRFETEVTDPQKFIRPVGAVTALEGAGAAALASIQRYAVTELRNCRRRRRVPQELHAHGALRRGSAPDRPLQHRPAHHAELRGSGRAGHLHRPGHRHPRVRGAARRDLRDRPRRRVRHDQPARRERRAAARLPAAAAGADGRRRRRRRLEPLRREQLQRLQREHHRDRGADPAPHARRPARERGQRHDRRVGAHAAPAAHAAARRAASASATGRCSRAAGAGCRCRAWRTRW